MSKQATGLIKRTGEIAFSAIGISIGITGSRLTDEAANQMEAGDLWTPAALTLLLADNPDGPDHGGLRPESPA